MASFDRCAASSREIVRTLSSDWKALLHRRQQRAPIIQHGATAFVDGVNRQVGDVVDGDEAVAPADGGGIADVGAGEVGVESEDGILPPSAAVEADAAFDGERLVAAPVGEENSAVTKIGKVGRMLSGGRDAPEVGLRVTAVG